MSFVLADDGQKWDSFGDYVEFLDLNVVDRDAGAFQNVLTQALKRIDPDNELTIKDSCNKLSSSEERDLFYALAEFEYRDGNT